MCVLNCLLPFIWLTWWDSVLTVPSWKVYCSTDNITCPSLQWLMSFKTHIHWTASGKMATLIIPVFPWREIAKIIQTENIWQHQVHIWPYRYSFDCWLWAWLALNFNRQQQYFGLMWNSESEISLLTFAHSTASPLCLCQGKVCPCLVSEFSFPLTMCSVSDGSLGKLHSLPTCPSLGRPAW